MQLDRKSSISPKEFEKSYLSANKPLIITDAMTTWNVFNLWNPAYLKENFGDQEVQIYDSLFNLTGIIFLKEYINKYFGIDNRKQQEEVPYIRWYTQLKNYEFVWADSFFEKISKDWETPYFLPKDNYLLPSFSPSKPINPVHDNFPAKGVFISAKGAKTKLHCDPWHSDAVLCQIYGEKK